MIVLLAVKVAPSTVDSFSGLRTAYDFWPACSPATSARRHAPSSLPRAVSAFLGFGYR